MCCNEKFSSLRIVAIVFVVCFVIKLANSDDLCFLPKKEGFCRAMIPRWYYNPSKGSCSKFIYGGCYANDNNFITKHGCLEKCQGFSCKTQYKAVGCFAHDHSPQLGYVLLNDRDVESKVFGGTLINWLKWSQYVPNMLCRCAEKAEENGFKKFAIYNLAECWGTNDFEPKHFNKSTGCLDRFYGQQCKTTTDMCVGGSQTHYYYSVVTK